MHACKCYSLEKLTKLSTSIPLTEELYHVLEESISPFSKRNCKLIIDGESYTNIINSELVEAL